MSKLTIENGFVSGVDIYGKVLPFSTSQNWIHAINIRLVELEIPNGIVRVNCHGNYLKTLKLPSSVKILSCDKDLFNYDECNIEIVDIAYE